MDLNAGQFAMFKLPSGNLREPFSSLVPAKFLEAMERQCLKGFFAE